REQNGVRLVAIELPESAVPDPAVADDFTALQFKVAKIRKLLLAFLSDSSNAQYEHDHAQPSGSFHDSDILHRPGLLALGFGLWALGFGLWALGSGLWLLAFGSGLWAPGCLFNSGPCRIIPPFISGGIVAKTSRAAVSHARRLPVCLCAA